MKNLVTVKTYSDFKRWSTTYTYRLIKEGKLKNVEIDGVRFIILDDDEYKQIKPK